MTSPHARSRARRPTADGYVSPCQFGARTAGSRKTTREAGSSGIAAITWVAAYPKKMPARSNVGRPFDGISRKSSSTVNLETRRAGRVSDRLCFIGLTIVAEFDRSGMSSCGPAFLPLVGGDKFSCDKRTDDRVIVPIGSYAFAPSLLFTSRYRAVLSERCRPLKGRRRRGPARRNPCRGF